MGNFYRHSAIFFWSHYNVPIFQNAIKLINVQETVITDTHLMYQTFPQKTRDADVTYSIVSPPQNGVLLLSSSTGHDSTFSTPQKLRAESTFSQVKQILFKKIIFVYFQFSDLQFNDKFDRQVVASDQINQIEIMKKQSCFFKWAKPGLFLFLFSFFSQYNDKYSTNLTINEIKA